MRVAKADVVIIGGGPAGMAAALAAANEGASVLIIERNGRLGGILNQCIHDGFGLIKYGLQLTGPEYASLYEKAITGREEIEVLLNALVTEITFEKNVYCATKEGIVCCRAKSIVLASGCRERTRGAITIPGTRPAGVYTAGVAQEFMNIHNISVGRKAVILGSGDIGLIMARRLTLEGTEVVGVFEKLPYCSGLPRNMHQCLDDYNIPLYLSRTVRKIRGFAHIESVVVSDIDPDGCMIEGTDEEIECDVLILSVGLIPENELLRTVGVALSPVTGGAIVNSHYETSIPGVFSCGNALHVNDLVDYVSDEGELSGKWAAIHSFGRTQGRQALKIIAGNGIRYLTPCTVYEGEPAMLSLRVTAPGRDKVLLVTAGDETLLEKHYPRVSPAEIIKEGLPDLHMQEVAIEVNMR
jgi:NADPH-dependent 2,4-dienoyl-CoA reductase/sulfur reductase-like enzyme